MINCRYIYIIQFKNQMKPQNVWLLKHGRLFIYYQYSVQLLEIVSFLFSLNYLPLLSIWYRIISISQLWINTNWSLWYNNSLLLLLYRLMIQDYRTIKTRTISIIRSLRSLCISIIISVMTIILYTIVYHFITLWH